MLRHQRDMTWSPSLSRLLAASARREGNEARARRDWAAAATAYRRYLRHHPDAAAIHVQLGHMLKESGDLPGAAQAYDDAARLAPDDADLLFWMGDLHRRRGDMEGARHAFAASLAVDGNADAAAALAAIAPPEPEPPAAVAEPIPQAPPEPAAPEPADPPPPPADRWVGHVDHVRGAVVSGWAVDPDRPGEPIEIEFEANGHVVGIAFANLPRADLAAMGGSGYAAQLDVSGEEDVLVHARLRHTGEPLRDSPFIVPRRMRADDAPRAWQARFEIVKPLGDIAGELALFVTHSRTGAIKPHVAAHIRALAAEGIAVLLVVVADKPVAIDAALLDLVAGAMVRENGGYDFACWAHALRLHPEAYSAPILYLMNDSVFGPVDPQRFATMIARVRASDADLVALTESHEHRWHAQSYFLALKPGLLADLAVHRFFGDVRILAGKDDVIQRYETGFAPLVEAIGRRVEVLFPSHAVRDPTLFGWRELLDDGFPYVKMLLLRGAFPMIDLGDWRATLAAKGFDLPLLDRTLAAGTEGWEPAAPGHPLLARPHRSAGAARQLRIAFFGPWNYDNGLGSASRGLIAAIRRCDVQLNLYPVEKPFHVHKSLVPPVPITDFSGPADIAIVHLNPDSWHLLTDGQRALIAAARKRIGHWVWEMAHIPPAWRHDFSSVDRIWAPSGYCAALFEGAGEAPVDVVPYTVPLPQVQADEAAQRRLRAAIGVPAGNRVILFAFDGSSYLIRKNPMALVRAFAASGLARHGWSLVLKTKHLFDREAEGRALEAVVAATAGVVLINASMSAGEMADLAALCDIYASPHCSEGFGLTIAEAMAAGKPVIATDFGGSTQFLDASCGYPVPATPWRLEDDFGHYTKGGEWARIDEVALTGTLRQAARAVDAGDGRMGEEARRRVGETLSYAAIGRLIAASFEAVVADAPPIHRQSGLIASALSLGIRFADARLEAPLVAVPLAADLTPPAALPPLPADREHWIVFAPADACIAPLFRREVLALCHSRMDIDIVYADDLALGEPGLCEQLRLKPGFDLAMLVSADYVGAPVIVRASAFRRLGGFDPDAGQAALADLLLRAHALGMAIAPLHQVLLAWTGARPVVSRDLRRRMIGRLPAFAAHDIVDGLTPGSLELRRRFGPADTPEVTIVIPTRRSALPGGEGTCIERLLEALAATDWPMDRLRVLVGDDVPGLPAWQRADRPYRLDRVETPRGDGVAFNYSAKMNRLWQAAGTEHIVLMNDDVLPRDAGWLRALMTFAVDESVGGVGARLLHEDGRLQHAGMAPIMGLLAHLWARQPGGNPTYQDWALVQREWSMVTGAVFATRRSLMEQVNGFDERLSLEYNDVDLCLRMRALGLRIVYTPHAELYHIEKASRGAAVPPARDLALFLERWNEWLASDPAFPPGLRRDRFAIEPIVDPASWYLA